MYKSIRQRRRRFDRDQGDASPWTVSEISERPSSEAGLIVGTSA